MLPRPHALLLDFGGVLADAPALPPAPSTLVARLAELTAGAVPAERIAADLVTADRSYARWRDESGDAERPRELSHRDVWELVVAQWPTDARRAVLDAATPLSYAWSYRPEWTVRPGIREVLAAAADRKIPVAVVSNTLCGAAHRDFLAQAGLSGAFTVQLYSDEIGVRKPNPEMAWQASAALSVPVERAWFVGDTVSRDIACARRAGAGAAVLMRSPRTGAVPRGVADAVVDDGHGLCALLTARS